jgi:DNA-binding IclR family transcriptional regulator
MNVRGQKAMAQSGPQGATEGDAGPATLEKRGPAGTQTLLRGLALLELVDSGVSDVKGLAARLGTPRSTTHRLLNSLVIARYLHHVPHKGYLLGPKLIQLGMRALEQRPLVALAHPHLEALAEQTADTIHLGVVDGLEVFYLDKIPNVRGLEMRSRVGHRMPIASTGVGKALMIGLPRSQWRDLYEHAKAIGMGNPDKPKLPPWPDYERLMLAYAEQGWVYDREENEIGIRCVGVPIFDIRNQVVAAVSVASAVPYMPEIRMAQLGPIVRATAEAISKEMGWTGQ